MILTLLTITQLAFAAPHEDMNLLETLLKAQIETGTCETKCAILTDIDERNICLGLCQTEDQSVCQLKWLCTSPGCQTACRDPVFKPFNIHAGVQASCTVSWTVNETLPAMFIVAAEDQTDMWKVLEPLGTATKLALSESDLFKYKRLWILAVTEAGVAGRTSVRLSPSRCRSTLPTLPVRSSSASPLVLTPAKSSHSPEYSPFHDVDIKLLIFIIVISSCIAIMILVIVWLCKRKRVDNSAIIADRQRNNVDMFVDLVYKEVSPYEEENIYEELDEITAFRSKF